MKNKKLVSLALLVVAAALLLTACGGGSKASIVGKWSSPELTKQMSANGLDQTLAADAAKDVVMEFTADGRIETLIGGKTSADLMVEMAKKAGMSAEQAEAMKADAPVLTYKVDGNKLTVSTKMGDQTTEETTEFKLEGDKLTFAVGGNAPVTLNRVK